MRSLNGHLDSLHAKNAAVFAVAWIGSIAYGCHAAASLACGGGIQIVNLIALDRSLKALASRAARGEARVWRPLLFLRFAAVAAAVGIVLWAFPVEVVPFVVGLSTLVPAALWHGATQRGVEPPRLGGSARREG